MSLSKLHDDSGIPKWQIALAFGGVTIFVAGAYYFYIRQSPQTQEPSAKKEVKKPQKQNIVTEGEKDPVKQAQEYKAEGNRLYKANKYEEAIKFYTSAIDVCPEIKKTELATFYQNRAAAYEQLKDWANVLKDCTSALDRNERYLKALTRRAKACEILKDLEQALEDLTAACIIETFSNQITMMHIDRVLKNIGRQHAKEAMDHKKPVYPSKKMVDSYMDSFSEDPVFYVIQNGYSDDNDQTEEKSSGKSLYERAKKHLNDAEYEDVLKCCNTELENPLSNYRPECLLLRGTLKILLGLTRECIKDFDEVLQIPDISNDIKVNAIIKKGTIQVTNDDPEKALATINEAVKLNPNSADAYHHRGQVNLLIGNVDDAIEDFNKAVSLSNNFPIAVVQKCYTEYRYAMQSDGQDQINECMKKFEETIKKFPNCIESYILYAQVLTDSNKYDKANEIYIKAKKVEPDNANILVHQGMLLLQKTGDLKETVQMLNKAIEMDEANQLAYENLATIHVQSGNLKDGVENFDKAIFYARTELEMSHLFALRDAAVAQLKVVDKMGIVIPSMGM